MSDTVLLPASSETQAISGARAPDLQPSPDYHLLDELDELIQEIKVFDPPAATSLTMIRDHLNTGADFDTLWSVDLYSSINPTRLEQFASQSYRRHSVLLNWLEVLRNLLVLVPIFATWFALFIASHNYAATLEAQPELNGVPFLLLWEQGFSHGILTFLRFSWIAFFDFLVILVIIVLTFLYHRDNEVLLNRANEQSRRLRLRLERALWEINLLFTRQRIIRAPDSLIGQLAGLVADVRQERANLGETSRQAAEAYSGINQLRKEYGAFTIELARQQGDALNWVTTNIQSLANTASTIQFSLKEISENISRSVVATHQAAGELTGVSTNMKNMVGQLEGVSRDMQNTVRELNGTLDTLRGHIQNESDLYAAFHQIAQAFPGRDVFDAVNAQIQKQYDQLMQQNEHLQRQVQELGQMREQQMQELGFIRQQIPARSQSPSTLGRFVDWMLILLSLSFIIPVALGIAYFLMQGMWPLAAGFGLLMLGLFAVLAGALAQLR
ncbi:MAG: hypothetical protein WCF84_14100 [Anaerolineae bacterium]